MPAKGTRQQKAVAKAAPNLAHSATIQQCIREDNAEVVERKEELDIIWWCLLANVHPLFIGVPGVAKSMTMRLAHRHIQGATYFERLVFKQSPAEEILGPVSLKALEQDIFKRQTRGRLPEAHLAFIDEVFKAPANVLNSMLKIINERQFDNNGGAMAVPLWSCAFASNELPGLDRDDLRAFRDRIGVTKIVHDVRSDDSFKSILRGQVARRRGQTLSNTLTTITADEVEEAVGQVANIDLPDDILDMLVRLRRQCEDENLHMNPRRFGEGVKLMQARAYTSGRDACNQDDIKVFQHVIWRDPEDEQTAYRIILDFASKFERDAAKFMSEYEPIQAEFNELKAKGRPDPNDPDALNHAIRVNRLLETLGDRVEEALDEATKQKHDASSLDDLSESISQDRVWLQREAFGMKS